MYTYLISCKGHIDEDITDEDQHYAKNCEWKCLSVVVEVLGNIHVIESNQGIKVFLFYLNITQFSYFHYKLLFLLLSKRLVDKNILNVCSFFRIFIHFVFILFYIFLC